MCLSSISVPYSQNNQMGIQNMQNQNMMNLVLSTDAKPRLKWTTELHQRFIEAVNQLGGPYKATPKSLMRMMGIHGLTLYHLKSHLQKYRLGKSNHGETCNDNLEEDYREVQSSSQGEHQQISRDMNDGKGNQINENLQISHTLQMQMEVQRKLHEQIEVQRHLQVRIEAQGKYLQSVLIKAQETLAEYNSSVGIELAKAELSQLVTMVTTGCPNSSITELPDDAGVSVTKHIETPRKRRAICSMESSLTSSESSGRKEEHKQPKNEIVSCEDTNNSIELSLTSKKLRTHDEKNGNLLDTFDLNTRYDQNEMESGSTRIDLNFNGIHEVDEGI